jgi:hypothetical protein
MQMQITEFIMKRMKTKRHRQRLLIPSFSAALYAAAACAQPAESTKTHRPAARFETGIAIKPRHFPARSAADVDAAFQMAAGLAAHAVLI